MIHSVFYRTTRVLYYFSRKFFLVLLLFGLRCWDIIYCNLQSFYPILTTITIIIMYQNVYFEINFQSIAKHFNKSSRSLELKNEVKNGRICNL